MYYTAGCNGTSTLLACCANCKTGSHHKQTGIMPKNNVAFDTGQTNRENQVSEGMNLYTWKTTGQLKFGSVIM